MQELILRTDPTLLNFVPVLSLAYDLQRLGLKRSFSRASVVSGHYFVHLAQELLVLPVHFQELSVDHAVSAFLGNGCFDAGAFGVAGSEPGVVDCLFDLPDARFASLVFQVDHPVFD